MKKTIRLSLQLIVLSAMLSGCIIWPGWYDESGHGHGGHHGGHRGGWHDDRR
jgi:hypothetical protein